MNDEPIDPRDDSDESEDRVNRVDRDAILARRKVLLVSALAGLVAANEACEKPASPQPCLGPISIPACLTPVWPDAPATDATAPQPDVVATPRPCLMPVSVRRLNDAGATPCLRASTSSTAPVACLFYKRHDGEEEE